MICLLIMTFIFINGIENAEQKARQPGTILREDDLDSKTKAWLLMVESGKMDEDQVRKITPKSIFIAPLLTSRSTKCKEGYRHDHLGQCVKVIKLDQRTQLELLLKRLSAMYSEKKPEPEEGLSEISSGPLHFSLPISAADSTTKDGIDQVSNPIAGADGTTTVLPTTVQIKTDGQNDTEEFEYSGSGAMNETNLEDGSGFEGSGSDADDACCKSTTAESATLISDDFDYLEIRETTTELTTTEVPYEEENYNEATTALNSDRDENTEDREYVAGNEANAVRTEVAEKIPTRQEEPFRTRIVFPEVVPIRNGDVRPIPQPGHHQAWNGDYRVDMRKLPVQQFWWLPQNWRLAEEERKPAVFKFWSHLPLVRDPSFVADSAERFKRPFFPSQPLPRGEPFQPSTEIPQGFAIELQQPVTSHRRGRLHRGRRSNDDFVQTERSHYLTS